MGCRRRAAFCLLPRPLLPHADERQPAITHTASVPKRSASNSRRLSGRMEGHEEPMETILVIGASGFVGKRLTRALLAAGYAIRCLTRDPARLQDLAALGCEIVQGDIADLSSVQRAMDSVQAVYVAIHTLSPQPASPVGQRFMAVVVEWTAEHRHGLPRACCASPHLCHIPWDRG